MADDRSTSFEDSLKRLEQIVKALETDDTDLERAVALYKEGRELVSRCESLLKTAQQSIDGVNTPQPARPAEDALDDDEFPA